MSRKVRRTLYLDQEAYEAMVAWSDELGCSHSELVRDLVSKRPPGKGEPDADALTASKWWFSRTRKRQVRVAQFHAPDEGWENPPAKTEDVPVAVTASFENLLTRLRDLDSDGGAENDRDNRDSP